MVAALIGALIAATLGPVISYFLGRKAERNANSERQVADSVKAAIDLATQISDDAAMYFCTVRSGAECDGYRALIPNYLKRLSATLEQIGQDKHGDGAFYFLEYCKFHTAVTKPPFGRLEFDRMETNSERMMEIRRCENAIKSKLRRQYD